MKKRIIELEAYSRMDNIIIHGITESYAGVAELCVIRS